VQAHVTPNVVDAGNQVHDQNRDGYFHGLRILRVWTEAASNEANAAAAFSVSLTIIE
jgi:hypothetical protein